MVKKVWLLKQPFSYFGHFKIRARLGIRLVGPVVAVTTLWGSVSLHWLRVRALLCMAGRGCLWPSYGPTAAGPASQSCCCPPRATMKPLLALSPCRRVRALLARCTTDPPYVVMLPLPSHHRRVCTCPLYPLRRYRPSSRPPLPRAHGRAHRRLVI